MPARRLSELETVILGLIGTEGPCTAYAVRRRIEVSLSAQWSGSAGAVYPAVKRLRTRKLILARADARGRRESLALTLSAAGRRVLLAGLEPPIDAAVSGIPADPLRVRLRFLELLPPLGRRAFVAEAISVVGADLERVRADVRQVRADGGSAFELAMARGALLATRARLSMLEELAEASG